VRILVIGLGVVGLTAAVGCAASGFEVTGVDINLEWVAELRQGRAVFAEPGLAEAVEKQLRSGRLTVCEPEAAVGRVFDAAMVVIPARHVEGKHRDGSVAEALDFVDQLPGPAPLVVVVSTLPPGLSEELLADRGPDFRQRYAYVPEFLNQGSALEDWASPQRIVVGTWNPLLIPELRALMQGREGPWMFMTPTEAEVVKIGSNAFVAMKITYANTIERMCWMSGADADRVLEGIGGDARIGKQLLQANYGYADHCLPHDVQTLIRAGEDRSQPFLLFEAIAAENTSRPVRMADRIISGVPESVRMSGTAAMVGLCYEPHNRDLSAAPSRVVVEKFVDQFGEVRAWDPQLRPSEVGRAFSDAMRFDSDLESVLAGAAVVVIMTRYPSLEQLDWKVLSASLADHCIVVDGVGLLEEAVFDGTGVRYVGPGGSLS
jgi:UDPglucose 6-dehydrogenase